MRILFLLTQDLESPSGLGRYLPLAKELSKLGHKVNITALHSNFDNLNQTKFDYSGVQVNYVAPMHVKKTGDTKSYYSNTELMMVVSKATISLSRKALETNPDIIHIAKPHPMNSIAGLLAKYLRNQPLFLDCDDYEAGSGNFRSKWQRNIVALFEKQVPRRVNMITTNTRFMQEKLSTWGVPLDQIIYLPNGVDKDRFARQDFRKIESLRNELNLEGKKVIAYIGTLSLVSHPVNLLIEAFHNVRQLIPESVLLIVGGGEDSDRIKKQVKDLNMSHTVIFCGRVPPDQIIEYYALADVSVDPVHDDDAARGRSPLKLFESWACGIPFVTSEVGDRKMLISNPPAGLLAKPGDQSDLSLKIITLLQNPLYSRELANTGLKLVQNFTTIRLSSQLENHYLDFLQRKP